MVKKMKQIDEDTYNKSFNDLVGPQFPFGKRKAALEFAIRTREFEIELYWKRATYFWVLIAAMFTALFLILSSENKCLNKYLLAFQVSCAGGFFTYAWFLANKGSKFWQENWENQIDFFADQQMGPIYRTVLRRPEEKGAVEKESIDLCKCCCKKWWLKLNKKIAYFIKPDSYSVSKINQICCLYVLFIWIMLAISLIPSLVLQVILGFLTFGITLIFCFSIEKESKSDMENFEYEAYQRESMIKDQ